MNQGILIIDDDLNYTQILKHFLEDQGFRVTIKNDGSSALQSLKTEIPELILLDINLPDTSGKELLAEIRKNHPECAVIVITGYGGEQVAVEMMRAGAIDFLSKPIEFKTLLEAIHNSLKLRQARLEERGDESLPTLENFFPFLAHEIRNPLHAIGGALAVIQRRSDLKDEPLAQSVRIIKEEVHHLSEFVQECLDFVRPPNKKYYTEIDINEVLSLVLNIVRHIYEEYSSKIMIHRTAAQSVPKILANYEEIKQALLNIVKNNYEAMLENGGQLEVQTCFYPADGGWVEVLFIDQGQGIKKENLKHLFTPFFTTKLKGTGLGLPICHRIIVDRHQGRIAVESQEGRGTRVTVRLPVRQGG
ncbi:MAG TPA: response regulator [Thermodesulfobacteriota bacterium]|nr:response regulator [Thermodesulfobacteriota bacterium]